MIENIRYFFEKHSKHISSVALFGGFIFDYFTLTNIDRLYDNLVVLFYLIVVTSSILVFNFLDVRGVKNWLHAFLPTIIQFSFGGLFSGFTVFYSRSTDFSVHLLFLLLLVGLLIGNEILKERYNRLTFQVSLLFVTYTVYMIFVVPLVLNAIGAWVFILSSLLSLACISLLLWGISKIVTKRFQKGKKVLFISIASIFLGIQILYFTNIIPPIPLILKDSGVYMSVSRISVDVYVAEKSPEKWYEFIVPGHIVRLVKGQPVFVYSSVYSPGDFRLPVVHHWQYFNDNTKKWLTTDRISFSSSGGRDGGYRGYTKKNQLQEGVWRVDIETGGGQIIGREVFTVEYVDESPEFLEELL